MDTSIKLRNYSSMLNSLNSFYYKRVGFRGGSDGKVSACNVGETWVRSLAQEDPLEKAMATHSSTLPRKFHGWRSLVGYSPWGRKELDTTERLHFL